MTLIASSQRSKGLQDMRWLRLSVIAGLLLPGAAMAADMPGLVPPPVAAPPAQILPSPANAAWYLRGDLGYYWGRMDGAQSAPGFANPSGNDLGNSITGGVGVGVKTRWLRARWRPARFSFCSTQPSCRSSAIWPRSARIFIIARVHRRAIIPIQLMRHSTRRRPRRPARFRLRSGCRRAWRHPRGDHSAI